MLWSLLKLLAFVAVVGALTWGGAYLMEQGGGAIIAMGGYEVTLTPLQLAIGLLLFAAILWLVLKLLGTLGALFRFLNGDNTALSRHFSRRRERKGMQELTSAAVALASGEGKVALAYAQAANRHLDRPDLTHLLIAQAAEMAGDLPRAEESYKLLARHEGTRFAGLRGLMRQKLAQGDDITALRLAEKAFEINPRHRDTQDVLLRLQAESHDWAGARRTLEAQRRSGALPRDVHKRRDAVLALSQAADVIDEAKSIEAREAAIEANRLSPDLIPAAVMAARQYIAEGNPRSATRILRKAWDVQPHPDLAAAFAEIVPNETPRQRLERFRTLTSIRTEHPETRMLVAELLIAADDFHGARRALGDLPEREPSGRNLTLMAAVSRGLGEDEATVRGWLTRALAAPRGPQWVCDNCGRIHPQWVPICANCRAFDTLSWKTPPAEASLPSGIEFLPLLVRDGRAADPADAGSPELPTSSPPSLDATEGRVRMPAPME
jgi:HemY protein